VAEVGAPLRLQGEYMLRKLMSSDNRPTLPEMNILVEIIVLAAKDKKKLTQVLQEAAPEDRAVLHRIFERVCK
jgi:hypothetical protein